MKKLLTTITGLALPVLVRAQLTPPTQVGNLPDLSRNQGIVGLASTIINIVLLFAGIIAVLFLIIGGYQYIVSGANEELAQQGKKTIQNSIIGLIVIILSFTIVRVIFETLRRP